MSWRLRFLIRLWRVLTWRHPRCVNCQDANRERLERQPAGLWACTACLSSKRYSNTPPGPVMRRG